MLEKTLESPLDCKRSNQSIIKEVNPEYSLEGLMQKMKRLDSITVSMDMILSKFREIVEDRGSHEVTKIQTQLSD